LQKVINRGREPGLLLSTAKGEMIPLTEAGNMLLSQVQMTGELLDQVHDTKAYGLSINSQKQKLEDASLTPSAQLLTALKNTGLSYSQWIMQKSREHKDSFSHSPLNIPELNNLMQNARASLQQQQQMEAADNLTFDQFLAEYLA
ncbi:MAG: hypothetical protein WBB19_04650, partial [Desulforhopalus sp.]